MATASVPFQTPGKMEKLLDTEFNKGRDYWERLKVITKTSWSYKSELPKLPPVCLKKEITPVLSPVGCQPQGEHGSKGFLLQNPTPVFFLNADNLYRLTHYLSRILFLYCVFHNVTMLL